MGYLEIENLYKDQRVLLFKKLWATEKIHGTSAWITYENNGLKYHSGGGSRDIFVKLFDHETLLNKMKEFFGYKKVKLYGEFYGGEIQNMGHIYGKESDFIMFDIKVDNMWLSFDKVILLGKKLNISVVEGEIIDSTIEEIERVKKKSSTLSLMKGCGEHIREGIVLKPLEEFVSNNGNRVIAKHKNEEYSEIKTPRKIDDPIKLKILEDAKAIVEEWVTPMRLLHVLDKFSSIVDKKDTGDIIKAMVLDIEKESKKETIITDIVKREIGNKTRQEFFIYLNKTIQKVKN